MCVKFWKKVKCYFVKHQFVRYPMLDGDIHIICTKCDHTIIKKRESIIEEEYLNE